jgi:hypothetical protein
MPYPVSFAAFIAEDQFMFRQEFLKDHFERTYERSCTLDLSGTFDKRELEGLGGGVQGGHFGQASYKMNRGSRQSEEICQVVRL